MFAGVGVDVRLRWGCPWKRKAGILHPVFVPHHAMSRGLMGGTTALSLTAASAHLPKSVKSLIPSIIDEIISSDVSLSTC